MAASPFAGVMAIENQHVVISAMHDDTPPRTSPGNFDDLPPPHLGQRVEEHEADSGWQFWQAAAPFFAGMAPVVALGTVGLILGTFLAQIWATSTDPGAGLAKTASWFTWAGRALLGGGLIAAALRPSPATAGVRVAMVAVGALMFVGITGMSALL